MPAAQRLDCALVARGLSPSRTAARKAIEAGRVSVRRFGHPDFLPVNKASTDVVDADELTVQASAEDGWVSRGALKLQGVLEACNIPIEGRTALDVGQSTGGFTEVLLSRGAKRVLGLEVGHGQLHPTLRKHPQVLCIEGVNARDVSRKCLQESLKQSLMQADTLVPQHDRSQASSSTGADAVNSVSNWLPAAGYDVIVMDVSFISLLKVSGALKGLMAPGGHGIWLVKPQFEVGPSAIGKGGLVKPDALGPEFEKRMCDALQAQGWRVKQFLPSPITGGDGNREYFVWVCPESS